MSTCGDQLNGQRRAFSAPGIQVDRNLLTDWNPPLEIAFTFKRRSRPLARTGDGIRPRQLHDRASFG